MIMIWMTGSDESCVTRSRATGDFLIDGINRTQFNVDVIGTYFKQLGSDFTLKLLGGYNYNKRGFKSETLFRRI